MKINVTSISEIEPNLEYRKPSTLTVEAHLTEYQMQQLFYQLWEDVGDEILNDWLKCEGKQMIEKATS